MSPYCYAADAPIKLIDREGKGPIDPRTWERTSSFIMLWDEAIIFRVYEKSNAETAYDRTLFYLSGAMSWAAGEPFARFGEDFSTEEQETHFIKGGFVNRLGKIETNATIAYRVGGSEAYKTAAESGNYDFKSVNIGGGKFSITSVKDGVISQINKYEKNSSTNEFELTSSTAYNITYTTKQVECIGYLGQRVVQITTNRVVTETTKDARTGKVEIKTYTQEVSTETKPIPTPAPVTGTANE